MDGLESGGLAVAESSPAEEPAVRRWLLDGFGLALSLGVGYLIVQMVGPAILNRWMPGSRASLPIHPILAFLIGFAGLDYLQYWTHRSFHLRGLWRFHLLHHTLVRMNGTGAFRHSLWECALNPVFWCHGALAWLLANPSYYLIAVTTGFILDVWRHAPLETQASGLLGRLLRAVLVTPEDHAVHHREPGSAANYGGNLKVWDRLHGTYLAPDGLPAIYGVPNSDTPVRLLFGAAGIGQMNREPLHGA